jgi:hypothetical protein
MALRRALTFFSSRIYLDANSKTKRANIYCPYAIGFNAKEIPQKVFMRTSASSPRWLRSKA